MYSNKLFTPLRYPGGKARFAPLIADVIQRNGLVGGHYLEPYAGGAGVALVLLMDGVVEHIHINDVDPAVAVFWRIATNQAANLSKMIADEPVTMDAWHHWREVMFGYASATELERGFATLFMNRTNRSGILKGGVIGGKAQCGSYKLNARFMREEMCKRIERIGQYSDAITVYEEDALGLLRRCHQFLQTKSLIYLDPPYYVKGTGLYRNAYTHDDHVKLSKLLTSKRFRRSWVVSYDKAEAICDMYACARSFSYGLHYTAQRRYRGAEVMFFSDRLALPPSVEELAAA